MQKQLLQNPFIQLCDFKLDDDFPIVYANHVQRYQDLNQLHFHHILEIGYCLEGNGLFFINNQVRPFQKGDLSIIFPHQPHIAHSPNETPSSWIFISVDLERILIQDQTLVNHLMLNKHTIPHLIHTSDDDDFIPLIEAIIHELNDKKTDYDLIIRHLLSAFIIKLLRLKKRNHTENQSYYLTEFSAITPALQYIQLHYAKELAISDLAQLCNMSVTHFRVIFKKATTFSPLQYITDVRMKMAKTLLKSTQLPILSIAQNVGYSTISSFNRTFKELYHITPTEYRKSKKS